MHQGNPTPRPFGDRLAHAFFRWESAVTIALIILLAFFLPMFFPGWQPWYWLVLGALGLVAESLIVVSSLGEGGASRARPGAAFDVRTVRDLKLRGQAAKALEYRQRMEGLVQQGDAGWQTQLREVMAGVTDWTAGILDLARRLDAYKSAPAPAPRLRDALDQAERQLENTLAALGTIYIQLQLARAEGLDSGRAQRLRDDVAAQIGLMQDAIVAVDGVQGWGAN